MLNIFARAKDGTKYFSSIYCHKMSFEVSRNKNISNFADWMHKMCTTETDVSATCCLCQSARLSVKRLNAPYKSRSTDRGPLWGIDSLVAPWLASRLTAQEVVSSTPAAFPVARWGVTVRAANNCDVYHVAVLDRLFTHQGMLRPTQPFSFGWEGKGRYGSFHSWIRGDGR